MGRRYHKIRVVFTNKQGEIWIDEKELTGVLSADFGLNARTMLPTVTLVLQAAEIEIEATVEHQDLKMSQVLDLVESDADKSVPVEEGMYGRG